MPLKKRATGLSSPVDEHLTDFTVLTGEWVIGRIYEVRGSPPDLRWFWSLHLNGPMKRADRVASLEEAKNQLKTQLGRVEGLGKLGGAGLGGTLMSPTSYANASLGTVLDSTRPCSWHSPLAKGRGRDRRGWL